MNIEKEMDKAPLFSIVIPCYNAKDTIFRMIDCVKNQTCSDWELIIVDDASTDGTKEKLEALQENRISVICNDKNLGQGPSRNEGIKVAKGEYILFWDADDEVEDDALFLIRERIEKRTSDVIVYSLFEEYTKGSEVDYTYIHSRPDADLTEIESIYREIAALERETMLGYPWNKAYRLCVIKENNVLFPAKEHIEDILFNIDFMRHVNSLCVVSKPLYHYKNGGSEGATAKKLPNYFELQKERIEAFLSLQENYTDSFVLETAASLYFRSFVSFMERNVDNKATLDIAKREIKTELFDRLKKYVGGSKIAKLLYEPLAKGQVDKTYKRVRIISFIRRKCPGIFNRLKQNR